MHATRQQSALAGDENKKAEGKLGSKARKGAIMGQRRALADVGNLVGAMNRRCIVSKDQQTQDQNECEPTRMDNMPNAEPAKATSDAGATAVPEKWGSKSHRTHGGAPCQLAAVSGTGSAASNVPMPGRVRMTRATRAAMAKLSKDREQSTTATLTACSEEACGGCDEEMADAESYADIDSKNKGDVLHVTEYVEDIYAFYCRAEAQSIVSPDYMTRQVEINDKMRAILLDWLVEVHLKFKLLPETLYLTSNLIDRFLAVAPVTRKTLQLVGVTAMLLASKYEEIWAPEVKDFVYISDNAYTKDEVLSMEKRMLNTLTFNLTVPTPYVFLVRYLKAAQPPDERLATVANFLVELSLVEYSMVQFSPSHLAAAAVHTALRTLGQRPFWPPTLRRHSGYTEVQLRPCMSAMIELHQHASANSLLAVYRKYSHPKFGEVAKLPAAFVPADDCTSHA